MKMGYFSEGLQKISKRKNRFEPKNWSNIMEMVKILMKTSKMTIINLMTVVALEFPTMIIFYKILRESN